MSSFFNLKVMVSNSKFGKNSPVSHILDQFITNRTVGIIFKFVIKIKFSIHFNKFHSVRYRVYNLFLFILAFLTIEIRY